MSLTGFNFEPLYTLSDHQRLVDNPSDSLDTQRNVTADSFPVVDIHESPEHDQMIATFELPGLNKEDIKIEIQQDRLTVSGESESSTERNENGRSIREKRYNKFSRSIPLPSGAKPEDIKAGMEQGVLTVTFPKASTTDQPHQRISIT